MRVWPTIEALALALTAVGAAAQTLVDTSHTLGKKPDPVTLEFQVAAAGNYRITLTDFGTATGPQRMRRVDAGVTRGSELLQSVNVTATSTTNVATATFAATAGMHRLVLIGQPAANTTVGSAGVLIDDPVGGAILFDTLQTFTVPPPPTTSPADFELDVTVPAGSYTLTTTDLVLPEAMTVLHTTVVQNGSLVATMVPPANPIALQAGAGARLEVFVHAETGAPRGLVGVNLRDTATGITHRAQLYELGEWRYRYTFDVSAAANLTATLADLQFPAPLTSLAGRVVRDGLAVGTLLMPAIGADFAATPGTYTVYVDAVQGATPGSFGLTVAPPAPGAGLLETIANVVPAAPDTDVGAVDTFFDVTAAGSYTLTLTDFGQNGFFTPFTSIDLALTRDNQLVSSLTAAGSLTFAATSGRYGIAIIADPAGTAGEGLLGVRVRGGPGDAIVHDNTEAIGADFITEVIDVAGALSVDVRLTDFAFPAEFDALQLAVTRGAERVGEIVGAGTLSFEATPGRYFVNLLATPDATQGYSSFGLRAGVTPAAPVVTLAASAANVTVGGSVTLTWATENADACAASGGWSGSRATSGSVSSGSLNANTTFTLMCSGPGGSRDASVTVGAAAAQRSGGGGGMDLVFLLALGAATLAERRRRGGVVVRLRSGV